MAVSVLTFVNWRATLVLMQAQTASASLSLVQSAEGYTLMGILSATGALYDADGRDSPKSVFPFSVNVVQPYMISAVPAFAELDRTCRLVYSTYGSTATLADGQAFGLYSGLTALPPGLLAPAPLALLWNTATALWTTLLIRSAAATGLASTQGHTSTSPNTALSTLLANATAAVIPYATIPTDPFPILAALSFLVTNNVNAAVTNCTTWLGSLSFK
jgi:hypothetical protein